MQNLQELVVPISSSKLGERAYTTTGCHKKYVLKTSEKSHFEIHQYAMLPSGM